ncbi:uroporphyrinogen-III synthase [Bordetella sp. 2513F-2]
MPWPSTAILTRPDGRNEALARRLQAAGWEVLALPALAIEPLHDTTPPHPRDYDLVVFVSGNAARLYLEALQRSDPGARWPAGTQAATVGPATAEALRAAPGFGMDATVLHPPASAPTHDSEALWALLRARPLPGRVLLVRGTQGRDWLAERLEEAGAQVVRHAAYRRCPAVWPAEARARLHAWAGEGRQPAWLLTSGESIDAVAAQMRSEGLLQWWRQGRFVVTHPRLRGLLQAALGDEHGAAMVKESMPADEAIFEALVAA